MHIVALIVVGSMIFFASAASKRKEVDPAAESKNQQDPEHQDSLRLHVRYLERRKYYVETGNEVQIEIDKALLALSGGALGLSLTFLQFASLPIIQLETLESSWKWLGGSVTALILSMWMSRLHWDYEVDQEDQMECERTGQNHNRNCLEKIVFQWKLVTWLHSNFMTSILNSCTAVFLAVGIWQLGVFGYVNLEEKNKRAHESYKEKHQMSESSNQDKQEKRPLIIEEKKGLGTGKRPVPEPKPQTTTNNNQSSGNKSSK